MSREGAQGAARARERLKTLKKKVLDPRTKAAKVTVCVKMCEKILAALF